MPVRCATSVFAILVLLTGSSAGEPPPPYDRLLRGDDARTAADLAKQTEELELQGRYREAVQPAEKLLSLRTRAQGADHHETVRQRWTLDRLRKLAELSEEQRAVWQAALQKAARARELETASRLREALPLQREAVSACERLLGADHPHTADAYNNLAVRLSALGEFAEAEQLHRKTLAISRRQLGEDHPDTAASYNNLAAILDEQGRFAEAQPLYTVALQSWRRVLGENHRVTGNGYNNLATNLDAQGDHAAAQVLYLKALELRLRLLGPDHPDTANTCNNLAANYQTQGEHDRAAVLFRKALDVRRRAFGENHLLTANSYNNLGGNLTDQQEYARALPLFEKGLDIRRRILGEQHPATANSYLNVALALQHLGKFDAAQPLYEQALAINLALFGENHPATAGCHNNLATNLEGRGLWEAAQLLHERAEKTRTRLLGENHAETATSRKNLGYNLHAQGKEGEAIAALEAAVRSFEGSRLRVASRGYERSGFGTKHSPYPLLAAAYARGGRHVDAWTNLEREFARGFADEVWLRQRAGLLPAEQQRQERLNRDRVELQAQITGLNSSPLQSTEQKKALEDLLTRLRRTERELAELAVTVGRRRTASFPTIRQAMPPNSALLAWVDVAEGVGDRQEHWACVLRSTGDPVWVRLPGSGPDNRWTDDDRTLPRRTRESLASANTPREQTSALASRLAAQRLAPLEPHLKDVKHLFVVPVGDMVAVPLAALTERYDVSYVPSGTFLAGLQQQLPKRSQAHLLALGDPTFRPPPGAGSGKEASFVPRGPSYRPLPGTRREVEAIAALFPKSDVLTAGDASEAGLDALLADGKLGRYTHLHFATHGLADEDRAFESSLALAQDALPDNADRLAKGLKPLDGRLTAAEVLNSWKLNADLVVLSACATAIGKQGGGDGLLGFAQAFLLAGSRAVVLSLWPVDDSATALFMQRFYQSLLGKREGLAEPMGKAAALREARKWLRELSAEEAAVQEERLPRGKPRSKPTATAPGTGKPYAHPHYWAAFVLVGDPD